MNLARPLLRRPIAAGLIAVAIVLAGLLGWSRLPVAALPQVDFPGITVEASLPGASPESMASTVAMPLERALGSIAGVVSLTSSSNQGATEVQIEFELDRDIDAAAREVQAALNAVQGQLPAGMSSPPRFRKQNPSQAPIMALALSSPGRPKSEEHRSAQHEGTLVSSPSLPPSALYDAASTLLAQKLAQISGVGQVTLGGASLPAVRVQLDPGALAHQGLALDEVRQALANANAQRAWGTVEEGARRWQIQLGEPLRKAADFAPLIVRTQGDAVLRLGDVATVSDATENRYSSGFHNQQRAVVLTISRRGDANIVATIDAITAQLPALRALMPPDAQLSVVMDRSPGIRASLRDAQLTLAIAAGLVVGVVWLFLGRLRAALIPSLALPVALTGAFAAMALAGFSLNNLSLMALIVAAGLVIDDAIVVLEAIERHLEAGLSPRRAALRGAADTGFTLIAMNLALVIVFVSILFMGGLVERLFREFSITLVAAMLISLALSLAILPSLAARWLQPRAPRAGPGWMQRLQQAYGRSLDAVLGHATLTVMLLLALIGLATGLYAALPKTMLPQQDTGQLAGLVRGDDGFSFQVMQPKIEAYRQQLLKDPAVQDVSGTSGGSGGLSNAWIGVRLKPLAERGETARAVLDRLRRNAPLVPGGILWLDVDQDIRLPSPFEGGSSYLVLQSADLPTLKTWSRRIADAMREMPQLAAIEAQGDGAAQQLAIEVDRVAAQRLGIDMATIAGVLNNSFSQRQVATLYDPMNQYRVVMTLDPRFTGQPAVLAEVQVITKSGARVPLSAVASWRYGLAPDRVYHDQQFAAAYVGWQPAPGVTPTQARRAIDAMLAHERVPATLLHRHDDESSHGRALSRQPWLIGGVLLAVYLLLGMLYESLLHPLTILSTVPAAGLGALLALQITGTEFSLIALLGLFLLIGIVMKNAILMIDVALAASRRGGADPRTAIRAAAMQRLRPILMTNLAGLLGALPLALGLGEGAELRRPLGITIVGGLAVSQLLTLYTTPVVYLLIERWRGRARLGWARAHSH